MPPLRISRRRKHQRERARREFIRNAEARGATLFIDECPDLTSWSPIATSIDGAPSTRPAGVSESNGNLRNVTLGVPAPPERGFYRIRAKLDNHAP